MTIYPLPIAIGVCISLIAVVYGFLYTKSSKLESKSEDHEKRIQKIEDIQGTKIDELKSDFQDMERKIDKLAQSVADLSSNIHKSKNQENALNVTLSALLKHLEREQDKL